MNNETVHKYTIKLKGDGVYDIYLDDVHMCSTGSYKSALRELEPIMKDADEYKLNNTK